GLKTVEILEREGRGEGVLRRINEVGERLRKELGEILTDSGVEGCVSGVGSMFKVFFSEGGKMVKNYADALSCDKEKYLQFFHKMLASGVFLPPSQFETNFVSSAHTEEDLEKTVEAYKENLR
ncbi:aspartate aminotransferase family protein, partial [Thermococci archaeon]